MENIIRRTRILTSCYPKANRPKALIISNETFDNDIDGILKRKGNQSDVNNLKKCIKSLGFKADVKQDYTEEEIKAAIKKYADEFDEDSGWVMLFVMTHGYENGTLFAKDTHYNTKDLWEPFLNNEKFNGKLKLFVINACRGSTIQPKIQANAEAVGDKNETLSFGSNFPNQRDFLVAYSSMEKNPSYRDQKNGTYFIQAICKILQNMPEKMEILNFFTEVTYNVSHVAVLMKKDKNDKKGKTEESEEWACQTPVILSSIVNFYIIERIKDDSTREFDIKSYSGEIANDSFMHPTSVICADVKVIGKPVTISKSYKMKKPKIIVYHDKSTKIAELQALQDHFGRLNYESESQQLTDQTLADLKQLSHDGSLKYSDGLILVFYSYLREIKNSCEDNLVKIGNEFHPVNEIMMNFTSKNCVHLREKPKVFLFFEEMEVKTDSGDSEPTYEKNTQLINNNIDMLVFFGFENKILNCFSKELELVKDGENVLNIFQKAMNAAKVPNADRVPHFQSTLKLNLFFGLNTLENENETLRTENQDLRLEMNEVQTESATLKQVKISLEEEVKSLKNNIEELKEKTSEFDQKVSTLESDKEEYTKKIKHLEEQFSNAQRDKINLKNEKIEKGAENKMLAHQIDKIVERTSTVESEVKTQTLNASKLEIKVSNLECENRKLQNEKSKIEEENLKKISQLFKQVSSLELQNNNLKKEISEIEVEKTNLNKNITNINEKLNEYMEKEKKQEEKIEEIQKENQKLLTEKNDVEDKNSELIEENTNLSAQIESMKRELEEAKTILKNKEIVEAYRSKHNLEDDKKSIMEEACEKGAIEVVRALLDLGNVGANDRVDVFYTGLTWAAEKNHANVVSLLLDRGADVNLRHSNSLNGWTPLMYAARNGSLESAKVLVTRGADKYLRSTESYKRTALRIARDHSGSIDMIKYLVSVGVPE